MFFEKIFSLPVLQCYFCDKSSVHIHVGLFVGPFYCPIVVCIIATIPQIHIFTNFYLFNQLLKNYVTIFQYDCGFVHFTFGPCINFCFLYPEAELLDAYVLKFVIDFLWIKCLTIMKCPLFLVIEIKIFVFICFTSLFLKCVSYKQHLVVIVRKSVFWLDNLVYLHFINYGFFSLYHYQSIASLVQIHPSWLCLWYWNSSLFTAGMMLSFISWNHWRQNEGEYRGQKHVTSPHRQLPLALRRKLPKEFHHWDTSLDSVIF